MDVSGCFPHWVPVVTILFSLRLLSKALPYKPQFTDTLNTHGLLCTLHWMVMERTQEVDSCLFLWISSALFEQICSIERVLRKEDFKKTKTALTVCERCLYVRVCEPRRFGFPGPALMVPRLDDSVCPTPSTTHLEKHPGGGRCTSTRLGWAPYSRSILLGSPLQLHPCSRLHPCLLQPSAPPPPLTAAADAEGGGGRKRRPALVSQTTADLRASQTCASWGCEGWLTLYSTVTLSHKD